LDQQARKVTKVGRGTSDQQARKGTKVGRGIKAIKGFKEPVCKVHREHKAHKDGRAIKVGKVTKVGKEPASRERKDLKVSKGLELAVAQTPTRWLWLRLEDSKNDHSL
jgi:hypothetical protein